MDEAGACIGIVSRKDFLAQNHDPELTLADVAYRDVVTIDPSADLVTALQLMVDEDISHLPVVEHGVLAGICTRADILRARGEELLLERMETGWLAPVLQGGTRTGTRYVVVANQTLSAESLTAAIAARRPASGPPPHVHVVVPLSNDQVLNDARDRLNARLESIGELGVTATGEIGSADALLAVSAAVRREPTNEVLLSTLPRATSRWLSSDLPRRIRETLDVEVTVIGSDD